MCSLLFFCPPGRPPSCHAPRGQRHPQVLFFSTEAPRAAPRRCNRHPQGFRWRESGARRRRRLEVAVVASELTLGATTVGCQYAVAATPGLG